MACSYFIIRQFHLIKYTLDKDVLDYVKLSSFIDTSFSRLYIRWCVDIKLKEDRMLNNYDKNYESYQLWGKNGYYDYKNIKCLEHEFRAEFNEYNGDIKRFTELLSTHYPQIKIYNFITDFRFIKDKLYYAYPNNINILVKDDNGLIEKTIEFYKKNDTDIWDLNTDADWYQKDFEEYKDDSRKQHK